jgi:hypothetical protein
MRRYQTESSEDFTKLVNSGTFRGIMSEMVNLKAFVGSPSDASEGLLDEGGSGPVTYYDMAEQALRSTLAEEIEEQGSITPERALELGRQVKEAYQTMAEDTEQNPLKSLADEYRRNGTSQSFYNRYRFYSGNPFMSKEEIQQELVDMGAMLDPRVLNATPSQVERAGGGQQVEQPTETAGEEEETAATTSTTKQFSPLLKSLQDYLVTGETEDPKEVKDAVKKTVRDITDTPVDTENMTETGKALWEQLNSIQETEETEKEERAVNIIDQFFKSLMK